MELGIIPKIDQFKDNNVIEKQQVQSTFASDKTKEKNSLEEIQKQGLEKAKDSAEVASIKKGEAQSAKYEVTLSNTNFGFNTSSKDFFVKVERGNTENQYPTQDMMKVKAHMLSLQQVTSENES